MLNKTSTKFMIATLTMFRKSVFILLIAFSSIVVQGQESKPTKNFKRIMIGVNFSPDYNFRTLTNKDGSSSNNIVIKSRNELEKAKYGYTTGLNVCINFQKHVALETGIQYSNKGYKTKNLNLIFAPPNSGLPVKSQSIYAYKYIGVPLRVKFTFGTSKIRFLSSAGFMTNFLLKVKQTDISEYANGKTEEKTQSTTSGFKKVDISPLISVGIDYKLTDKIHVLAEPTFRYGVLKTRDAPVKENLWSTGVNIGVYHGLK